jgi:hypothetical protein
MPTTNRQDSEELALFSCLGADTCCTPHLRGHIPIKQLPPPLFQNTPCVCYAATLAAIFTLLTRLKPLKVSANTDQNLGKRWTPLKVQACAPRVLFLEDSTIARVYQCKSIAMCDHGIVTTKTLLLEMLILFGSDEFLNICPIDKLEEVIVVPNEVRCPSSSRQVSSSNSSAADQQGYRPTGR